jgi:hypothetical protein
VDNWTIILVFLLLGFFKLSFCPLPPFNFFPRSAEQMQSSELLGFWTCPSTGILNTRKQYVSETRSVSVPR